MTKHKGRTQTKNERRLGRVFRSYEIVENHILPEHSRRLRSESQKIYPAWTILRAHLGQPRVVNCDVHEYNIHVNNI